MDLQTAMVLVFPAFSRYVGHSSNSLMFSSSNSSCLGQVHVLKLFWDTFRDVNISCLVTCWITHQLFSESMIFEKMLGKDFYIFIDLSRILLGQGSRLHIGFCDN